MKKQLILAVGAAVAFTSSLRADVEIRITGASAFRQATLRTIKAKFDSAGALGTSYSFAHDKSAGGTNYDGSTRSVWKGTFPGVAGTTTIRCNFTGSVEGIRAVALGGSYNETYLTDAALTAAGENGSKTSPTSQMEAKFAFSDVRQSSTPITSPVLSPGDPRVGVVTFTMLANQSAPVDLTNVTAQQARALLSQGYQPLSLFTGKTGDENDNYVFAVGRNDGSGTRTLYLAEIGYGITNPVNQYVATSAAGDAVNTIQLTPAGSAYKSTVWGYDMDGNGGYASGSNVRDDMGRTTDSVTVLDAQGSELLAGSPVYLLTWLSTGDAKTAVANGARTLAYNGVSVDPANAPLSAEDQLKVTTGQYTAWGYENLYYNGSLSSDENTVYSEIVAGIPSLIGSSGAGIPMSAMAVSRSDDGGTVMP